MTTEDKKYKEIAEIIIDLKLISKDIKEIQSKLCGEGFSKVRY
jgi:hypothetical protein